MGIAANLQHKGGMTQSEHSVSPMTKQVRVAPIVAAAVTFFVFELTLRSAQRVIPVAVILPLFYFLVIAILLGSGLKTRLVRFKFLIAPAALSTTALAFLLLVEASYLRHAIAFVVAVVLIFFFESLATYIWRHSEYEAFSLENLSGYTLTLATFFGSASVLGFAVLLDVPWFVMVIGMIIFSFLINYKLFWISKIVGRQGILTVLVLTLLQTQLIIVLRLIPLHFMTSGAIVTLVWYVSVILLRASALGLLTRKMVIRHLALGAILLALLLGTPHWI